MVTAFIKFKVTTTTLAKAQAVDTYMETIIDRADMNDTLGDNVFSVIDNEDGTFIVVGNFFLSNNTTKLVKLKNALQDKWDNASKTDIVSCYVGYETNCTHDETSHTPCVLTEFINETV